MRQREFQALPEGTKVWAIYDGVIIPCVVRVNAIDDNSRYLGYGKGPDAYYFVGKDGDVGYRDIFLSFKNCAEQCFSRAFKKGWK